MVRYPYLLFDADDTLLDFSRNGDKAFSLLCAKYCFPYNEKSRELFEAFNQPLWRDLERGRITKEFLKTERFRRFLDALHRSEDPARGQSGLYGISRPRQFFNAICRGSVPGIGQGASDLHFDQFGGERTYRPYGTVSHRSLYKGVFCVGMCGL